MPTDLIDPTKYARGEVRCHEVSGVGLSCLGHPMYEPAWMMKELALAGWARRTDFMPNQFLYEWGAIFGNLLMRKGLNYGIGGMYIEFENVGTPGDPVAAPAYTRDADEGVAYYNDLATSPDRDYLRVPLVASTMDSTDLDKFPNGNRVSFFAQTAGVVGVHGKPFSDADNSVVFGGALVAFVDETDHTRDLVLSRFYCEVGSQQPKLATSQVGFEWRLILG